MFLCDDCHDTRQHVYGIDSLGRCEGCGKVRVCIDCHIHTCKPPKKNTSSQSRGKDRRKRRQRLAAALTEDA